jgi:PTS system glucose-specific IIC component
VTFVAVIPLSFLFMFTWPGIGIGLNWFGVNTGKLPHGVDSLIFEMIERSLVPLGLHHVFYAPLWWTSAGGSISSAVDAAMADSNFAGHYANHDALVQALEKAMDKTDEWKIFYGAQGDQTMMYQIIAHPDWLNFKDMEELGFNLGRFQSGKFAFMMFGLPMASLAMFLNVPKKNRKEVFGIYFSAAFTCFLTGITEPLEYTFLFVAPWLFYGVHMPLAALSFFLTGFMSCHVAMTVSGGFIDYIVFGLIPITKAKTNPLHILWIGAIMAVCYFTFFYFAIYFYNKNAAKKNKEAISLPGMRGESEAHLFTKTDFKQKAAGGNEDQLDPLASVKDAWYEEILKSEDPKNIKAAKIINYLGGPSNIVDVDACASRLRVTVNDDSKVNLEKIKALGGTTGGLVKNNNVQIVYGGEQEAIKPRMKTILENIPKQTAKAAETNQPVWLAKVIKTGDKKMIKAAYIIEYLGGPENIVDVDACASRLRVTVKDDSKVNLEKIKSLGGTTGGLIRNNNVQVVYGGEQEAIKPRMIAILEEIKIKK